MVVVVGGGGGGGATAIPDITCYTSITLSIQQNINFSCGFKCVY